MIGEDGNERRGFITGRTVAPSQVAFEHALGNRGSRTLPEVVGFETLPWDVSREGFITLDTPELVSIRHGFCDFDALPWDVSRDGSITLDTTELVSILHGVCDFGGEDVEQGKVENVSACGREVICIRQAKEHLLALEAFTWCVEVGWKESLIDFIGIPSFPNTFAIEVSAGSHPYKDTASA